MTEIYSNISDEVRHTAEAAWRVAMAEPNPIDAAKFLNSATEYYTHIFTEEEVDFLRFYFRTQMEMMK